MAGTVEKDLAHTDPNEKVSKSQAQDKVRLPMWAWALVAGGGAVFVWYVYRAKRAAAVASTSASSSGGGATSTPEGCTDASGTTIACPTVVPYPVASTTGNTPQNAQEYQNLLAQIAALQGQLSSLGSGSSSGTSTATQGQAPATPPPAAPPAPAPTPSTPQWEYYTVKPGQSLSSIAAMDNTTWQNIYGYNTTPGNRSSASEQTIESRGPNLIYSGESILVPPGPLNPSQTNT